MSFSVNELCTSKIIGILKDEDGGAIDGSTISSFAYTLYDKVTEAIDYLLEKAIKAGLSSVLTKSNEPVPFIII